MTVSRDADSHLKMRSQMMSSSLLFSSVTEPLGQSRRLWRSPLTLWTWRVAWFGDEQEVSTRLVGGGWDKERTV